MRTSSSGFWAILKNNFLSMLFVVLLGTVFLVAINNTAGSSREEAKKALEDSIRHSVVSCYALEGRYPPTMDYLKEHYSILLDESRYVVYYDIFASNIMPEITVIER